MKKNIAKTISRLILVFLLFFAAQAAFADESVSVIGTINNEFQIVTDTGEVYNIGENENSVELDMLAGSKVEAVGIIDNTDGDRVIYITTFKVIESTS
jgi:hypothetical protein